MMFDSMPANGPRSGLRRRSPEGSDRRNDDAGVFDILAVWDGDLHALREQVDAVSGWGPFELFETIPLFEGRDGRQRVLCRFMYHGAASDHLSTNSKPQFKYALLNCLRQITEWEDVAGQAHLSPASV